MNLVLPAPGMGARALPPLASLRAFEAAARHGSFRAAAEELAITQSAVSHQIAGLERRLGTALFRRKSRRVELTEAGAAYYPFLRDAFDRIAQGTGLVSRQALAGELMIQVYVTVAVKWLIPRLHRFQASEPEILVRMSTNQLDWEFDPATGDLGIICTRNPDRPNLHLTPDGELSRDIDGAPLEFAAFSAGEQTVAKLMMRLTTLLATTTVPFCWIDEPLEHLDPVSRQLVGSTLAHLSAAGGLEQIFVTTYEEPLARRLAALQPGRVRVQYLRTTA